ncbi:MAG: YncE family protein, partial [Pseudomonadota bacterium]|nr:YncE family protein [Pseudomonadota bacterium]
RALIAHGDRVTAVDLKSGAVTADFAAGSQIHTALPINDGQQVLITNGATDTATIVNGKTGALESTVPTGNRPDAATYDPSTKLVLVMDHKAGDITLIDTQEHKAVGQIQIGGDLEEAAVDGDGRAYVTVEDKNEAVVIDIKGRTVVARYKLDACEGPTGIVFAPKEKQLIIACDGSAQVRTAKDGALVKNFAIGGGADGAAYDAADHLAFIPSGATGTLSVLAVDTKDPQLIETVETQTGARTIAFDAKTGRIYLPTAKFGAKPADGGRPPILPGSFEVLVVEKTGSIASSAVMPSASKP